MPQHQAALQLRSARHRRRGAQRGASVRAQGEWVHKPSQRNEAAFDRAVDSIAASVRDLLDSMETTAAAEEPRGRGRKARARTLIRFA